MFSGNNWLFRTINNISNINKKGFLIVFWLIATTKILLATKLITTKIKPYFQIPQTKIIVYF